jgi:dihydropyrimidinase
MTEEGSIMFDIGILNGTVWAGGNWLQTNVYIEKGRIACLAGGVYECGKTVDAGGMLVLPGFIDPHVHFHLSVGANTSCDDFHTGSVAGALGGVTTYIDFLDVARKASDIEKEFEKRNGLASGSITDYAFHTTIANPSDSAEAMIKAGLACGINSVKMFTTYAETDRRTYERYIYELLKHSAEHNTRIVVHSENDDLLWKNRKIRVADHELSRPSVSERVEVMTLAELARDSGGLLYIVHVSAGRTIDRLKNEYAAELKSGQIKLESCPHYFLFNSDVYKQRDGYKYTMTPPLRPEIDRARLVDNIAWITAIGTDHCPFKPELKKHEYTCDIPMGIGGIRYSFLGMYGLFGKDIVSKFTEGPARTYGLFPEKGNLLPGADADVVIFDEKGETVADDPEGVYEGRKYKGSVKNVFSRGVEIVHNGKLTVQASGIRGHYISRT